MWDLTQTSVIEPQGGVEPGTASEHDMWDLAQTSVIEPQGGVEPETASEHDR